MSQLATLFALVAAAAIVAWLVQRARLSRVRLERAEIHQRLERTERERTEADARLEREARERPRRERRQRGAVLEALLEVDDHVQRAAAHSRTSDDIEGLRQGIELLARELDAVWRRLGLARVPAEPGSPFDPALHEAISRVERSPDEPPATGAVVHQVLADGFMFDDGDDDGGVLRPARVVVSVPATRTEAPDADTDDTIGPAGSL